MDKLEQLAEQLGKRCRAATETPSDRKKILQHIFVKVPKTTPDLIRQLDRGMADACKGTTTKYNFLGYEEEVYPWESWKTLGTILRREKTPANLVGNLDCRELRFDGLYFNDLGGGGDYLRFYPDGEFVCAAVSGSGSVKDVARWLRREHKHLAIGTFILKVKSLQGEYQNERGKVQLKARLTKQGLKVRTRRFSSNKETEVVYAFYFAKLR